MWVHPAMTSGSSLGRSKWKVVQQSLQFLLQQSPSSSSKDGASYRIVTRSFPTYIVATSKALPHILDHFRFLHEEFLEQIPAKKPKDLVKNLKAYYLDFPEYQEPVGDGSELAEEIVTAKLNERIEKVLSTQCSPSQIGFYGEESDEGEDNESTIYPTLRMTDDSELNKSSLTVNLLQEIDRPGLDSPVDSTYGSDNEDSRGKSSHNLGNLFKRQSEKHSKEESSDTKFKQEASANNDTSAGLTSEDKAKHKEDVVISNFASWRSGMRVFALVSSFLSLPQGVQEISEDSNVWAFPLKFHTFLNYPSLYLDDGLTRKNSYQFLKEVKAVNTRRKVLTGLTLYSLLLRFCSLDLFFVVLFVSNCLVLYFMKNSTKVNLTIAKSSVKSKVGLAKQWAGGFIHKSRHDSPLVKTGLELPPKSLKKRPCFFEEQLAAHPTS
ncbi:hypothetical protein DSO57_1015102 [Entomophthora muscae]|uniref:Uncharacterized protein n=1 Tax=Entomophthora muscae TaxID=34485 RepID=A0ACC2U3J1_9FUNG|nr:hypothetical protein DSO57_1015102 [Entomophthora muscae]